MINTPIDGIRNSNRLFLTSLRVRVKLTRSLRKPGGPCTKSMEVSESRMERVKKKLSFISKRYRSVFCTVKF